MGSFIAVLILMRFKEIARFASISNDFLSSFSFLFYHIMGILPIAIPISALIAGAMFSLSLSKSSEITALRSAGLSLFQILLPVLAFSLSLCYLNFFLNHNIAPSCRRKSKALIYQKTSSNPLLLLQRQKLVKVKNAYIDMEGKGDFSSENFLFIAPNRKTDRLTLLLAKNLSLEDDMLKGSFFSLISHFPKEEFDSQFIENQESMYTKAPLICRSLKKHRPKLDFSGMDGKMLRLCSGEKGASIENLRRGFLILAPFTFSFLGCIFGVQTKRVESKRWIFSTLFFFLLLMASYLLGKTLKNHLWVAAICFFFPHLLVFLSCLYRARLLARGKLC